MSKQLIDLEGLKTYDTKIKGYVETKIANFVDSAPETLDTLNELAQALGDDPNFATTVVTELGNKTNKTELEALQDEMSTYSAELNGQVYPMIEGKVDKIHGKGLSANDFTDQYKNQIEENAFNVGRVSDVVDENNYRIGNPNDLHTDTTDNLVDAINEIYDDIYQTPIIEIPTTLKRNKQYNFGEVATLNLAFPTWANDGDVIYLTFKSGATPTALTIDTTNTCDIEVIPEESTGYEIFGKYNGEIWIVNYSEYTVSEV